MVNVKNIFGMAAIAAAMASCTDNDAINTDPTLNTGKSFATFKIELPTTNGTRADNDAKPGTPEFNGGDDFEYSVNDATVLVFQKDNSNDENDYKFVTSTSINPEDMQAESATDDGVTTTYKVVAELGKGVKVGTDNNYYALVFLNSTDKITIPSPGETYGQWSTDSKNADPDIYVEKVKDYGIIMANSPSMKSGNEPETLVKMSGVYESKDEAEKNPATNVCVEHGLVKVSLNAASDNKGNNNFELSGDYSGDQAQVKSWMLDITNKSTYPVHVVKNNAIDLASTYSSIWSKPRFLGSNRVYWGIDPNYTGLKDATLDECKEQFFYIDPKYENISDYAACGYYYVCSDVKGNQTRESAGGHDNYKSSDLGHSSYCLENTFDIDNMRQGQTTRVVVQVKYSPKCVQKFHEENPNYDGFDTFFQYGDNKKFYTCEDFVKTLIQAFVYAYNKDFATDGSGVAKITVEDMTPENSDYSGIFQNIIDGALSNVERYVIDNSDDRADDRKNFLYYLSNLTIKGENWSLYFDDNLEGVYDDDDAMARFTADIWSKFDNKLSIYADGYCYYPIRLKHFNELTPWAPGDATYGANNATQNEKYLGRYGILRNNWYDLTVRNINRPGTPEVPEVIPDTPDDEDSYINVSVKILDWAKRTQKVDL